MCISSMIQKSQEDKIKALLRKWAPRHYSASNVRCPACGYFGLFSHAVDCELAEFLTKALPETSADNADDTVT